MLHEPDFDDLDSNDFTDKELSDEDTEDASETDVAKQETQYTEIKEQMYQDKLAFLKKQLKQLEEGTLPEFLKRNKKIDQQYRERLKYMEVFKEYEEKKVDLKESLIADLEEKRRSIELERSQLELTGGHCNFLLSTSLDDGDIMDDLRIINKVGGKPLGRKPIPTIGPIDIITDVKIEDGRLYYDKRWFHRNQPVFVDCKDAGKFSGVITAIGTQEVWIRKTSDSSKIKIYLNQLQKGKFVLRRKQT
ncbi:SDS3-like protein [Mya arenaria]|uniref:SDS3-like protein n=1 Tax=Mya arenaria TaxID=6604 RepID=A0ABY7DY05_MYAAR|nr:SDS3-like protein [Mya arenaria]WAR02598.1 SDS3-like protein [Mya arenaria]